MKKFLLLTSILLILISSLLLSQPKISYIIPDIGAPGMNVYVDIICPFDPDNVPLSALNFGMDGVFLNNPGDPVRLECANPADTQKIIFGPIIVSWGGRMISSQVFIHPSVQPNSWDWELLTSNFKIPFKVTVLGVSSNIDTFYIVNPYHIGDATGIAHWTLGSGALGRRSRRGAMIVDSLILANVSYNVSTVDCDPATTANEAYLPFVLLSLGKVEGGTNTKITVDGEISAGGHGGNGGPGGGGGGGRFCDVNFGGSSGDDGGDGFTGGGKGGENRVIGGGGNYKSVGFGTGNNPSKGYSINGEYPPKQVANFYEASGGGTGHPFGQSGIATSDGNNDDPMGGFGGASGYRQRTNGGSGGYATNGISSGTQNGGRMHGNSMVVPIAGGSGGASGNPQKQNPFASIECSGSGGGGGGAIRLYAPIISNVIVSANGGEGHTGDNGAHGGGGSGGSASIHTRIAINGGLITAQGGLGGGVPGGAGRIRHDYPAWNFGPVTLPPQATTYRGPTTDTSNWVSRQFNITGSRNPAENVHFFIKPETGVWQPINQPVAPGANWQIPMDLTGDDSLYFFAVVQDITNPMQNMTDHLWDPNAIMSQSSANIFRVPQFPIIDSDTLISFRIVGCEGNTHDDTIMIYNIGKANLVLRMDSSGFKNPGSGFSLISPTNVVSVAPTDSQRVIVRYTYQKGQIGVVRDTLLIFNNDYKSRYKPWQISYEVNIDSIKYELMDILIRNPVDSLGFFGMCIGEKSIAPFILKNNSNISINLLDPVIVGAPEFGGIIVGKRNLTPGDTSLLYATYTPTSETIVYATFYIKSEGCNFYYDSLNMYGFGLKADLAFSNDIVFSDVKVGTRDTMTTILKNTGSSDAFITTLPPLLPPFKVLNSVPAVPILLKKGESIEIFIEYAPTVEGSDSTIYLAFSIYNSSPVPGFSCADTAYTNIKGNSVMPLIELNKYSIDYGLLGMCQTKTDTIIVTNRGTGAVSITSRGQITGANPNFFRIITEPTTVPYTLQPNGSEMYIIEFVPSAGASGTKNADFSISTDEPTMPNIVVPLTGRSDSIRVSAPSLIDFGGVPIGEIRTQTITLTNNGEFDVHVLRVDIDNPNVSLNPQTATITANGGTKDFNVSINYIKGGIQTAHLIFIFDIPCPDSLIADVRGEGLVGDIENTITLDFGVLAPCEDSVMTVVVTNTGNTSIEILPTPYVRGSDKTLFNVLDTNTYSKILNPGDTCFIDVQFHPQGSIDGIKQAELLVPVFMNNDTIEVITSLRGERRSGILFVPSQLSFGNVTVGTTAERKLVMKNNGTIPITITPISFTGSFKINPDPIPLTILQPGDSLVITVQFTPDSVKFYEDTLKFGIHVQSCDDEVSVIVNGDGAPAKSMLVWFPHLKDVPPDLPGYTIPIYGRLDNPNDSIDCCSFTAEFGFDSTLFYPSSMINGNILSMTRDNKFYKLKIEVFGINLSKTDSIITELIGYPLLGDTTYTDLKWYSFNFVSPEPMNSPTLIDGSFEIQICREGQDRLLRHGSPLAMSVSPNPADGFLTLDISVLETGNYKIELIGLTGGTDILKEWNVKLDSNKSEHFNLELGNISSGIYYLLLKSPTRQVVVPVIVVN
ncbi:MAG: choice-of-anchor D domain-containing protein [Bacteroidetes bacterium]|nr:MAG: choice-of-anchor D domain-containing protein [Bacteroidota bacterium]